MSFFLNYLARINPKKRAITLITMMPMPMIMVQTMVNTLARMPKMRKDTVTM